MLNPREIKRADAPIKVRDGGLAANRIDRNTQNGRDNITMAEMKARMAFYWKQGDFYSTIAEKVSDEFGLTGEDRIKKDSVHYHIKKQIEYWKKIGMLNIDEKQALLLARYQQLEDLITDAYFKSCEGRSSYYIEKQIERVNSKERENMMRAKLAHQRADAILKGQKILPHGNGDIEDSLVTMSEKIKEYEKYEINQAGDPKLLQMLIDINDKRCKLWNATSKDETLNADQEAARMSDEARTNRLNAVITDAMIRRFGTRGNLAAASPLGGFQIKKPETPTDEAAEPESISNKLEDLLDEF